MMTDALAGQYSQYCPECGRRLVHDVEAAGATADDGPARQATCSSRLCGWRGNAPIIQQRKAVTRGAKD